MSLRIILLIGSNPNQVALAAKTARQFTVAGIVLQKERRKLVKG